MSAPLPLMRHPTGAGLRVQRYDIILNLQKKSQKNSYPRKSVTLQPP